MIPLRKKFIFFLRPCLKISHYLCSRLHTLRRKISTYRALKRFRVVKLKVRPLLISLNILPIPISIAWFLKTNKFPSKFTLFKVNLLPSNYKISSVLNKQKRKLTVAHTKINPFRTLLTHVQHHIHPFLHFHKKIRLIKYKTIVPR